MSWLDKSKQMTLIKGNWYSSTHKLSSNAGFQFHNAATNPFALKKSWIHLRNWMKENQDLQKILHRAWLVNIFSVWLLPIRSKADQEHTISSGYFAGALLVGSLGHITKSCITTPTVLPQLQQISSSPWSLLICWVCRISNCFLIGNTWISFPLTMFWISFYFLSTILSGNQR